MHSPLAVLRSLMKRATSSASISNVTFQRLTVLFMRVDVLAAVSIMQVLSLILVPCGFVGLSQRFGETYCLHLLG